MPESQSNNIMDEINKSDNHKKIDESLGFAPPEADFKFFVTTLSLQASIALGHLENPSTGKTEKDPAQAKFLIDTLAMLQEKTKGNLTKEEGQLLENLLYELRLAYVSKEEKKQ